MLTLFCSSLCPHGHFKILKKKYKFITIAGGKGAGLRRGQNALNGLLKPIISRATCAK